MRIPTVRQRKLLILLLAALVLVAVVIGINKSNYLATPYMTREEVFMWFNQVKGISNPVLLFPERQEKFRAGDYFGKYSKDWYGEELIFYHILSIDKADSILMTTEHYPVQYGPRMLPMSVITAVDGIAFSRGLTIDNRFTDLLLQTRFLPLRVAFDKASYSSSSNSIDIEDRKKLLKLNDGDTLVYEWSAGATPLKRLKFTVLRAIFMINT